MQHIKHYSLGLFVVFALLLGALISAQPALAMTGDGTPESPYQIKDAEDLIEFARKVNYYDPSKLHSEAEERDAWAELRNDINLEDTVWTRIGSWSPFRDLEYIGTFDGKDHTIRGLDINLTDSTNSDDYQGLFDVIGENGVVKNLTVEGSITVAKNSYYRVGGVAGQNEGTVNNCISHVEINVIADVSSEYGEVYSGGVVGLNFGTVENCSNSVAVNTSGASVVAGGIVGANGVAGSVENCYNTGTVTASGSNAVAGGVIGTNALTSNPGTVKGCYNIGEVSGATAGGVVGVNSNSSGSSGTVSDCYFLVGTAASGVGDNTSTNVTNVASKTVEEFASGEVAWLLQDALGPSASQVWGQDIDTDKYPVLTSDPDKKVYQVTFMITFKDGFATDYANSGDNVAFPKPDPTSENKKFIRWADVLTDYTDPITVNGSDLVVYAVFTEKRPEKEEGYSINYSAETATADENYEISTDGTEFGDGPLTITPRRHTLCAL